MARVSSLVSITLIVSAAVAPRPARADDPKPRAGAALGYTEAAPAPSRPWVPWTPPPAPVETPPPPPKAPPVAFDLGVANETPIMLGGQATLELPGRILLQAEAGVVPSFYVDAADDVLVAAGAYDQNVSVLVRNGLENAFVFRASGGWRPFTDHGFEILGGYTLTSGGGNVSARQAVEAVTGVALPSSIPDAAIGIHSTVHAIHVSVGWQWVVADHLSIRASLGYLQALGSSSHVTVPASLAANPMVAPHIDQANQALDGYLDDKLKTYVKLPLLGLSLGYRF